MLLEKLIPKHLAAAALSAFIIAACSTPDHTPQPSSPQPSFQNTQPKSLSEHQINLRTTYYLALSTWADVIHSTYSAPSATQDILTFNPPYRPALPPTTLNFHQAIISLPHTACAAQFESQRDTTPAPPYQQLFACTARHIASANPTDWTTATPLEKTVRARHHLSNLWDSINPAVLVSVKLAAQRGVEMTPNTVPSFKDFADTYNHCRPTEQHVNSIAASATPNEMAERWHTIYQKITRCTIMVNTQSPQEQTDTNASRPDRNP